MPSASAYLDMILSDPVLKGYGGFRGVCRLAFQKYENDFQFVGHQPKTKAYDIVANVMDIYFGKNTPTTKRHIADRVGMKSLGRWSITATDSKEEYKKFQNKFKKDVSSWKEKK